MKYHIFFNYIQVLLFDKSYNTEMLATMIKSVLSETGTCLTLQNGMGNVEILQVGISVTISCRKFWAKKEYSREILLRERCFEMRERSFIPEQVTLQSYLQLRKDKNLLNGG